MLNVKKCMCWYSSIIELKNARWNIEILSRSSLVAAFTIEQGKYQRPRFHVMNCRTRKIQHSSFLGEFAKLRKSGFLLRRVSLPVRMEQLGYYWTDFHEIWYLSMFRKSVQKIQAWLKLDKNKGYFTGRPTHIYDNICLKSS